MAVRGDKLRTPAGKGILPGTTQAALFEYATEKGYRCKAKETNHTESERSRYPGGISLALQR